MTAGGFMANPLIIEPTLTLAGQAAAFNASSTGIELIIDAVSFGRAHYNPTGDEVALVDPVGSKVPLAGGSRPTPYQLRMSAAWRENVGPVPIGEIAYWAGDVLVFVWSRADGAVASYKTDGVTYVLFCDLAFTQVPPGSINLVIDPTESAALAALSEHEGADNAHPQYLRRSDVAKDSGPLAWLGAAGGTANNLVLTLQAVESELTGYAEGQRFQFKAVANNTGPVTANIEGLGAKPVKKSGDGLLVDLEADDIRAGALYDLNYDGTNFQLGGGVGSGKAFERFSFEASLAQTVFPARHTVGSIIVLRNGREVTDYVSDGEKVTLTTPCEMGDSVQILAFSSFKTTNTYTKAELQALLLTASALPVGGILPFPRGVVPAGYLELDGSVQKIATFPDLAAYLAGAFNKGDEPAGYFRLPDGRGEFLRGWDHGRGVDAGRSLGSEQLDALQNITGSLTFRAGTGAGLGVLGGSDGAFTRQPNAGGLSNTVTRDANNSAATDVATLDASKVARTATETRPRNLAVMWCIKAWSAPVNQGQIDIGALVEELTALRSSTPVGAILPFPKAQVPAGYLELDGSVQSAAAYPDLAAYLGTTYNTGGEPEGYFRLPDYRGEFLRGWDHGRGVDAGRTLGSGQLDAIQNITGKLTFRGFAPASSGSPYTADGPFSLTVATGGSSPYRANLVAEVTPQDIVTFDASKVARTATETRPRNLAVMWCIKAWNAPVNQGNIDIGALAVQVSGLEQRQRALGDGQTNQDLTANRLVGTVYPNTTGRTIWASVSVTLTQGSTSTFSSGAAGDLKQRSFISNNGAGGSTLTHSVPVLPGEFYSVTGGSLNRWNEVRV